MATKSSDSESTTTRRRRTVRKPKKDSATKDAEAATDDASDVIFEESEDEAPKPRRKKATRRKKPQREKLLNLRHRTRLPSQQRRKKRRPSRVGEPGVPGARNRRTMMAVRSRRLATNVTWMKSGKHEESRLAKATTMAISVPDDDDDDAAEAGGEAATSGESGTTASDLTATFRAAVEAGEMTGGDRDSHGSDRYCPAMRLLKARSKQCWNCTRRGTAFCVIRKRTISPRSPTHSSPARSWSETDCAKES